MAFVGTKFNVGEWGTTTEKIESFSGYFEKGTRVRISGVTKKGYDLVDEYGNEINETGFNSIKIEQNNDEPPVKTGLYRIEFEVDIGCLRTTDNAIVIAQDKEEAIKKLVRFFNRDDNSSRINSIRIINISIFNSGIFTGKFGSL